MEKFTALLVLTCLLCSNMVSIAQESSFTTNSKKHQIKKAIYGDKTYITISKKQFTPQVRQQMLAKGASIKATYPNGNVVVTMDEKKAAKILKTSLKSKQTPTIDVHQKIAKEIPSTGKTGVAITFFDAITDAQIQQIQNDFSITPNDLSLKHNKIIIGDIDASLLESLANLPEIAFISPLEEEPVPLNDYSIAYHQAGAITHSSGYNYKGEGVVIGVGDGGELGQHIDLEGRIYNEAYGQYSSYGDHADKVTGIIAGAGNINEINRGYAPLSTIVTQKTFRIFYYLDKYYKKYGMRLTNNSYGSVFSCNTAGNYNYYSRMLDEQHVKYNDVLHLVAVGNSGNSTCNGYPAGYGTVLGSYAGAKNILAVGAIDANGVVLSSSGKGPMKDGRMKPEIVTQSQGIISTGANNNYSGFGATSAATANATGGTALVYEAFQKTTGKNPEGALLKAILCNTADDAGNIGPDYAYGFGIMNLRKAVKLVHDGGFATGELNTTDSTKTFNIDVAAGQNSLKIMLAWSDISQPLDNVSTLMNDLNLTVTAPDGTVYQPWVLNPATNMVNQDAVRGEDNINNMEQVTVDTPTAGTYTITVKAKTLNSPSQKFAISHLTIPPAIHLTYPSKGMSIQTQESVLISWDSDYNNTTGYLLEYSTDNGATWNNIGTATATATSYSWLTPNIHTTTAQVRITVLGTNQIVTSNSFNILASPANLQATSPCGSYVQLNWEAIPNASSYQIYLFNGKEMEQIDSTVSNSYLVEKHLVQGEKYWFSVAAKYPSGEVSRRAVAISAIPSGTLPCAWANDIAITELQAGNEKGRALTSTSLSAHQAVQFKIKNIGNNAVSNINLAINMNGTIHYDTLNITLASLDSTLYKWSKIQDFSSEGTYQITASAHVENEDRQGLNTVHEKVIQLPNEQVGLPEGENITNKPSFRLYESQIGVAGFEALDFETQYRMATLVIEEYAERGRVLRLIQNSYSDSSSIIITKNIVSSKAVFLGMNYKVAPQSASSSVTLFVRFKDTDNWIEIKNWVADSDWKESLEKLNLSEIAATHQKEFSSSTQFKFSAYGNIELAMEEFLLEEETAVLPVEMSYFRVKKIKNNALLEWGTASEENNDYFEVQVATETGIATGDFKTLAKIDGNGTTLDEKNYIYVDNTLIKNGVRYYRLKQVDFDGTTDFSEIRAIQFGETEHNSFLVTPNIIKQDGECSLAFTLAEKAEVEYILTTINGAVITQNKTEYDAGYHQLDLKLDTNISAGLYYISLRISNTNQTFSVPLVKS